MKRFFLFCFGILLLCCAIKYFSPYFRAKSYSDPPSMGQLRNLNYLNDRYGVEGEKACEADAGTWLEAHHLMHLYDWESTTWNGKLDEVNTWHSGGFAVPGILIFSSNLQMFDKNGAVSQFSLRLTCKYDIQAAAKGYKGYLGQEGQTVEGYGFEIVNE